MLEGALDYEVGSHALSLKVIGLSWLRRELFLTLFSFHKQDNKWLKQRSEPGVQIFNGARAAPLLVSMRKHGSSFTRKVNRYDLLSIVQRYGSDIINCGKMHLHIPSSIQRHIHRRMAGSNDLFFKINLALLN